MNDAPKTEQQPTPVHLSQEYKKRQRKRSIAIALGLVALIITFYVLTIVKMGPELFSRSL